MRNIVTVLIKSCNSSFYWSVFGYILSCTFS